MHSRGYGHGLLAQWSGWWLCLLLGTLWIMRRYVKGQQVSKAFLKTHCPRSLCQDHLWGFLKHPRAPRPELLMERSCAFWTSARVMLTLLVQGPRWVPDLATISPGPCQADSWDSDSDPEATLCLPWSRNSSSLWSRAPRGPWGGAWGGDVGWNQDQGSRTSACWIRWHPGLNRDGLQLRKPCMPGVKIKVQKKRKAPTS